MTNQPTTTCPCQQSCAAHSLYDAASRLGLTCGGMQQVMWKLRIGRKIEGRWHFTEAELATPRRPRGRPRREARAV